MARQASFAGVVLVLLALAGCANAPQQVRPPSPCEIEPASYACQVERYDKLDVP